MTGFDRGDIARVTKRLDKFAAEVDGRAMEDDLRRIGQELRPVAAQAVVAELGDMSMSGWHRGRPVALDTRVTVHMPRVYVTPDRTAGLWRVLESGRQASSRGDRVARGVTKKGNVRYRRVKRNVGATAAKHTWSEAERRMVPATTQAMNRLMAVKFKRVFGG